jgi:hypothetical protein
MRVAARATALALLVGVLASACSGQQPAIVDFSDSPRNYLAKDYPAVSERWTRHEVIRWDFADSALEAWVIFKSWDFRESYVERYAALYSLSEADKLALRASQLEAARTSYEFHISAQSAVYKWNDLEKRNSPWRISLVDGLGHELLPEFVKLQKLPEAYEIEFFPKKTPFTRTYLVRFSKAPLVGTAPAEPGSSEEAFVGARSGSLTLRIASPLGRADFTWQGS